MARKKIHQKDSNNNERHSTRRRILLLRDLCWWHQKNPFMVMTLLTILFCNNKIMVVSGFTNNLIMALPGTKFNTNPFHYLSYLKQQPEPPRPRTTNAEDSFMMTKRSSTRLDRSLSLEMASSMEPATTESKNNSNNSPSPSDRNWGIFGFYVLISVMYWYFMVLGAAAKANGYPIPHFIPMTPGWPATEADFQPLVEDSYHFFYLSEVLGNTAAPHVIPPRLAVFNLVEAWIFAFLPALWYDTQRRLPRPALLSLWLILGINLTNAFLAPYLAITELRNNYNTADDKGKSDDGSTTMIQKNRFFTTSFALISLAVVTYALGQCLTVATSSDWAEFQQLVQTDRSYLAFCVDPVVMSIFQPLVLARVRNTANQKSGISTTNNPLDFVPFVGLVAWLLSGNEEDKS